MSPQNIGEQANTEGRYALSLAAGVGTKASVNHRPAAKMVRSRNRDPSSWLGQRAQPTAEESSSPLWIKPS